MREGRVLARAEDAQDAVVEGPGALEVGAVDAQVIDHGPIVAPPTDNRKTAARAQALPSSRA
jgi:hypothetical protein